MIRKKIPEQLESLYDAMMSEKPDGASLCVMRIGIDRLKALRRHVRRLEEVAERVESILRYACRSRQARTEIFRLNREDFVLLTYMDSPFDEIPDLKDHLLDTLIDFDVAEGENYPFSLSVGGIAADPAIPFRANLEWAERMMEIHRSRFEN